jgi:hypothetical protein
MSSDDSAGIPLDEIVPQSDTNKPPNQLRASIDAWFGGVVDATTEDPPLPPEFDTLVAVGDAEEKFLEEQDVTADMVRGRFFTKNFNFCFCVVIIEHCSICCCHYCQIIVNCLFYPLIALN